MRFRSAWDIAAGEGVAVKCSLTMGVWVRTQGRSTTACRAERSIRSPAGFSPSPLLLASDFLQRLLHLHSRLSGATRILTPPDKLLPPIAITW